MFSFSSSLRIFVGLEPVDMRKSSSGLYAIVKNHLGRDPLDGAVYLFANKRRTLVKIICWDGAGIWVLAKRLEKGTYWWPGAEADGSRELELASESLSMILSGVDLKQGSLRPWYAR